MKLDILLYLDMILSILKISHISSVVNNCHPEEVRYERSFVE